MQWTVWFGFLVIWLHWTGRLNWIWTYTNIQPSPVPKSHLNVLIEIVCKHARCEIKKAALKHVASYSPPSLAEANRLPKSKTTDLGGRPLPGRPGRKRSGTCAKVWSLEEDLQQQRLANVLLSDRGGYRGFPAEGVPSACFFQGPSAMNNRGRIVSSSYQCQQKGHLVCCQSSRLYCMAVALGY